MSRSPPGGARVPAPPQRRLPIGVSVVVEVKAAARGGGEPAARRVVVDVLVGVKADHHDREMEQGAGDRHRRDPAEKPSWAKCPLEVRGPHAGADEDDRLDEEELAQFVVDEGGTEENVADGAERRGGEEEAGAGSRMEQRPAPSQRHDAGKHGGGRKQQYYLRKLGDVGREVAERGMNRARMAKVREDLEGLEGAGKRVDLGPGPAREHHRIGDAGAEGRAGEESRRTANPVPPPIPVAGEEDPRDPERDRESHDAPQHEAGNAHPHAEAHCSAEQEGGRQTDARGLPMGSNDEGNGPEVAHGEWDVLGVVPHVAKPCRREGHEAGGPGARPRPGACACEAPSARNPSHPDEGVEQVAGFVESQIA